MKISKKLSNVLLFFVIFGLFGACSRTEAENKNSRDSEMAKSNTKKILVAYFSATGTTKEIATYIAQDLKADIFEIVPEVPYTSNDLNYGNDNSRTSKEMNDNSARPAIKNSVQNFEQYDVIFLGYPIWWGNAPKIMSTFVESYDFKGKTVIPFVTSGSSGIGSSAKTLEALTKGATWEAGQRFGSGTSKNVVADWVNTLDVK
ncbi:flavodoxin [Fusobacterium animalis]|uniref:flavodoxin n=1 Tax=Fusobacterium animalis TaxID=76859 RepID=UPI0030D2FC6F